MGDFATPFTPVAAALGGAVIGLSAVVLLAANGRLAGISSIVGALIGLNAGEPPLMPYRFAPARVARAMLAAPVLLAAAFTAVPLTPAHAERICDIIGRVEGLKDGERLTIRGRIDEDWGHNGLGVAHWGRNIKDFYEYVIRDSCGEAWVGSARPINCRGQVTVTGEFNWDVTAELLADFAIWAKQASCE